MASGNTQYSARYCTACGALCKKKGSSWICPKHGMRDSENGVTTSNPDE